MKKKTKKRISPKAIKELAEHLEREVEQQINVAKLPNGAVGYKHYLIKQTANETWGLYSSKTKDMIEQFYLKSTALIAAKHWDTCNMLGLQTVKQLDRQYWSNHVESMLCRQSMPKTKDFDRYLILLNKLEQSDFLTQHYKDEISRMFKWSLI